ncbi:MAG TPA: zincin-like metallopeptidase domain-containing protein [Verrucomicrobiae bacterium]|nr:zincin-like metallopeptidase domain-containing protein [Verrucomicrobiae bacterium]
MSNQVYGYITDKIMEELEQGCVPWHKPWKTSSDGIRVPTSFVSKKPYRGVNTFLLALARFKAGYDSNYWLTFKQVQTLGGSIKGQKTEMVVFWKMLEKPSQNPTAESETDYIPMLRYYRVFNLDQVEGIKKPTAENLPVFQPIAEAEAVATRYQDRIEVTHGGARAYYQPSSDSIRMPERETFDAPEAYYSTLFHEFTHSTGHESRLNRPGITETHFFGDEIYSKEELVAEMGAAMLCGVVGIENKTIKNSASYIQSWLSKLRDDKKLVVHAAAAAQKAADFILNRVAQASDGN